MPKFLTTLRRSTPVPGRMKVYIQIMLLLIGVVVSVLLITNGGDPFVIGFTIAVAGVLLWWLMKTMEEDRNIAAEAVRQLESINAELVAKNEEGRKQELRYRLLADNASDFIWTTDLSFNYTFCSPACERLLGYKPDEMLGQSLFNLLLPEMIPYYLKLLEEELLREEAKRGSGRFRQIQTQYVTAGGSRLDAETTLSLLRDDDRKVIGIVGSTRDISERLLVEEERDDAHYQLRQAQKLDSIGQLAGGIAHDFNNMLVAIQGYSELIRQGETNSDIQLFASEIRKASERAANLTRQLLTFSRTQMIDRVPVDLNELVRELHNMLSRLIQENVKIEFEPARGLYQFAGDPGQLEQLIVNICLNARDAMPEGGVITISTRNKSLARKLAPMHGVAEPGQYVQLDISDNGTGMSDEIVERVFEPFFSTKAQGKGTGLGMAVVRNVVMEHGGFVEIHSRQGVGTTVSAYFPVSSADAVVSEEADELDRFSATGETILLVEDEPQVRKLVTLILERTGYQVIDATNGVEGLKVYEKYRDDIILVLSDIIMPEMGGRGLMKAIRARDREVPFLFITGYSDEPGFVLESGFEFVQKPFSAVELISAVQRTLESGQGGEN